MFVRRVYTFDSQDGIGSLFSQYVAFFSLDVHVRRLSPGIWVAVF